MNPRSTYKNIGVFIISAFLSLLLIWLTVSLPFVYEAKQTLLERHDSKTKNQASPLTSTTEEKTPSNSIVNINEEYIHHSEYDFSIGTSVQTAAYMLEHEALYIAFHGELHAPPPNVLL